jgi:hypothetical protein
MFSFAKKYFKRVDFISSEVGFELDDSKIYKTFQGAFISISILISCVILGFLFGRDLYERKLPIVSRSNNYLQDSVISLKKYSLFFLLSDTKGNFLSNYDQYFSPTIFKINRTNSKTDYANYPSNYKIVKCNSTHFSSYEGKVSQKEIESYVNLPTFCLDLDDYAEVKNSYAFSNSSYVNVGFTQCNISNPNVICAKDFEERMREVYVRMFYLNNYIDSTDYHNPVKYYIDVKTQQVSRGQLKRNYFRFINDKYVTDNGWLIQSISTYDYVSLKDVSLEINSIADFAPLDLYWITIESPQLRNYYFRRYMKLQDLFASIGGIINAFIIFSKIVFYHYMRKRYLYDISCYLLDKENEHERHQINIDSPITVESFQSLIKSSQKTSSLKNLDRIIKKLDIDKDISAQQTGLYYNEKDRVYKDAIFDNPPMKLRFKSECNINSNKLTNINKAVNEMPILYQVSEQNIEFLKSDKDKERGKIDKSSNSTKNCVHVETISEVYDKFKKLRYLDFLKKDLNFGDRNKAKIIEEVLKVSKYHLNFFSKLKR